MATLVDQSKAINNIQANPAVMDHGFAERIMQQLNALQSQNERQQGDINYLMCRNSALEVRIKPIIPAHSQPRA